MAYKAPIWEDGKSPAISAENLNALSQAAEGAQVLYGNSAPTSSTEGAVGQFYLVVVADSDGNYPLYQCVAIANGSYTWQNVFAISTSLASSLALSTPATIRDAIARLALSPAGTGTLYIHCKDEAGEPVSGCVVQIGEEMAVTGASGAVKYFLAPGTYSVTIVSPIDYGAEAQTKSVAVALSEAVAVEVTIQDSLNGATELRLTSSIIASFSNRVVHTDVFGVSGGGSGGVSLRFNSKNLIAKASGGAGGRTKTVLSVDASDVFEISVGAGGAAVSNAGIYAPVKGKTGGMTSVVGLRSGTLISLSGGAGGDAGSTDYNNTTTAKGASGGSGSGAAGETSVGASGSDGGSGGSAAYNTSTSIAGGSGQGTTTRAFGDSSGELFSSAGGSVLATNTPVIGAVGEGGAIGAAQFSASNVNTVSLKGNDASMIGGGGGAVAAVSYNTSPTSVTLTSGAGKAGIVIFRWEVAA